MKKCLNFDSGLELCRIGKALSSETRIQILALLDEEEQNVNEIAEKLAIPPSSAAMNVRVLEEAGLICTELRPGIRGSMKICRRCCEKLEIALGYSKKEQQMEVIHMPIGNYVDYQVVPTCGMVDEKEYIDEEDEPRCFYHPDRTKAQLIWFAYGYLEYRFSNAAVQNKELQSLELSAELCAEAVDYDLDYPSDITLWINGLDAGTWSCPSDFGGRRGKLNPAWWPDSKSQYGNLKTWRLDETGTYLDHEKVNDRTLSEYCISDTPYIAVRIGNKENARHPGGVNLFGSSYGDYPQDILLKICYK
ncbi:MAG: ArsR/SmtB family transcription factor [Lachnospiraceae bacterium]